MRHLKSTPQKDPNTSFCTLRSERICFLRATGSISPRFGSKSPCPITALRLNSTHCFQGKTIGLGFDLGFRNLALGPFFRTDRGKIRTRRRKEPGVFSFIGSVGVSRDSYWQERTYKIKKSDMPKNAQ